MFVKVIKAKASQAICYRKLTLELARGEMDAGGEPAGKEHLLHGIFHVPVCSSGSAVDFTIKELRTSEYRQWCGLAAFTIGRLVIPDEVQALIDKIQRSTALEQEQSLELSQFAPVGGGWIFVKGLKCFFLANQKGEASCILVIG